MHVIQHEYLESHNSDESSHPHSKKMDEKFIAPCRELPGCSCIDTTFMALGAIEGNRTHLFDSVYKFIRSTRSRLEVIRSHKYQN